MKKLFSNNYWFGRDGYLSVEVCRMVLALIYIYTNFRSDLISAEALKLSYSFQNYDPDSILMLLGNQVPSDNVINTMILIAKVSPIFLLLGLFSRSALWVTFLSNLFIRALVESFSVNWSHGFNIIFLANIPFLFASVGQMYSLDYLIKKYVLKKQIQIKNGFNYILLSQYAVALMFASAFFWKALYNNKLPFEWAYSDNMRNILLYRYEWSGDPVPEYIKFFLHNNVLCKFLAFGNLFFQLCSLIAVFFIHRPVLRLLFGLGFVIEEIGLSVIMNLHDYHWLPLIVFFVDWDYFFKYKSQLPKLETTNIRLIKLLSFSFIGVYLFFSLNVSAFLLKKNVFDFKLYPFSKFDMYSGLMCNRDGSNYTLMGTTFKIVGDIDAEKKSIIETRLKRQNNFAHYYSKDALKNTLVLSLNNIKKELNMEDEEVEIYLFSALYEFNPASSHLKILETGFKGKIDTENNFCYSSISMNEGKDECHLNLTYTCDNFKILNSELLNKNGDFVKSLSLSRDNKISVDKTDYDENNYFKIKLVSDAKNDTIQLIFDKQNILDNK